MINIKAVDNMSKEQLPSEIMIELNNRIIHSTNLSNTAWTEFEIPYNSTINIICKDTYHYTSVTQLKNYKQSSSIIYHLSLRQEG